MTTTSTGATSGHGHGTTGISQGDPRWREAAVLGSLWAASEIVLGSFLHNLKVPLRGHIMTAIAIVLLVAGHRRWPRRGLLWRAGVIAAAMKSASPSAVLLGPMLAIAMEGFAMELASRLFPRRLAGYLLGGALAMSWTMTHRLVSLLVTYGANLVTVYTGLVAFAEKQLGEVPLGAWGPIVALAVINVLLGAVAAHVGWRVAAAEPLAAAAVEPTERPAPAVAARQYPPSLVALAAVLVALPAGMLALGRVPIAAAAAIAVAAAAVSAWRYRPSLRKLRKPGFWIGLAVLTGIAAVVFAARSEWSWPAALAGAQVGVTMSLRAVFITLCFAALGVELANPTIRAWMGRYGAAPFLSALELSFAALPEAIAALPPARTLLRQPRRSVASLLPHLERWLAQARRPAA